MTIQIPDQLEINKLTTKAACNSWLKKLAKYSGEISGVYIEILRKSNSLKN